MATKAKVRISPALVRAAKDLRRASVTFAQIAVTLNVPLRTLREIFKAKGRLTPAKALKIRQLYLWDKRWSQRKLAKRFGVSRRCIYSVVNNETWNS